MFEGANTDPVWFPDGELIAFTHGPGMDEDIVRRRADGTGELEPLVARPTSQNPHSFSPDGRLLAFYERVDETSRDIWILNLDDRETKPFLVTKFNERSPSFSPDGRWLAYTSDESGGDEIYIQAYPGPGDKDTVSRGGGREPVWSRDGSEV
jgi:Tol biopolymer transport system component